MAAVCDKDCFHCPYPDCINDEMDHEDYVASAQRDKELRATPKSKKLAAQQKAYREANREKLAAQKKAYYEANREKVAAQKKAYYEANREKVAAQQKAIRQVRQELGLSLSAAAGILNVSAEAVRLWERGLVPCDAGRVVQALRRGAGNKQLQAGKRKGRLICTTTCAPFAGQI